MADGCRALALALGRPAPPVTGHGSIFGLTVAAPGDAAVYTLYCSETSVKLRVDSPCVNDVPWQILTPTNISPGRLPKHILDRPSPQLVCLSLALSRINPKPSVLH